MLVWDSSALVAAYLPAEEVHAHARGILDSRDAHAGSVLLWPEATSAVVRRAGRDRRLRDAVLAAVRADLEAFHLTVVDTVLIDGAVRVIRAHALRATDALHLAAALALARDLGPRALRFVTADAAQARAARVERLRVIELRA